MLSRRLFLHASAMAGCSAAAHPLLSIAAFASAPCDNRLVVIILRGAMDGIDTFQPYGDPNLRALRSTLSLGPDYGAADLDGSFALHPGLAAPLPLWQAGPMAFAPAVSTPYIATSAAISTGRTCSRPGPEPIWTRPPSRTAG